MGEVVVAATRTDRSVEDLPMPVTVISREQIQETGGMRLSEVFAGANGPSGGKRSWPPGYSCRGYLPITSCTPGWRTPDRPNPPDPLIWIEYRLQTLSG